MYYTYIKPREILAPYIKHYWLMEIDASDGEIIERVIPIDSLQLLFHYRNPFVEKRINADIAQHRSMISGMSTSSADVANSGNAGVIAVCFHPFGACNFFPFPLGEIENENIDLADIDTLCIPRLEEKVCLAATHGERIRVIEEYLVGKLKPIDTFDLTLLRRGVSLIGAWGGCITTSDLADRLYLTGKTLERKFHRFIGTSPKQYSRIIRFQKVLDLLSVSGERRLTDIAQEQGYFDQAHFIRDFKALTGYTPKRFFQLYPCDTDSPR